VQAYNPFSLPIIFGKIAPVGTGDSNALRLTSNLESTGSNLPYGNPDPSQDLWLNKLEIKAAASNGGEIYVCWGTAPYNESTTFINGGGTNPVIGGVIRAIDPGESWAIGDSQKLNLYRAGLFLIVISVAGDWCAATGDQR
jgi:hypothetical protein